MIIDSGLTCPEFVPGPCPAYFPDWLTIEHKLKRPPVRVVWKLGQGMPSQVSSSTPDHGLNYGARRQ
ncbi:hypothetical protein TNCV_3431991 [Trichonephila clavipes]|nr:hypothetical protein TNCV_3431991 [Trichonephila clavipes]